MYRTVFSPALVLLIALLASTAQAQSTLTLPKNADDIRTLIKPATTSGPCTTCGVVTNVRSEQIDIGKKASQATPGGAVLQGAPIMGTGTAVQDARKSSKQARWKVTVRYDNGQYAAFDQDGEPAVRKGDKIQVIDGRVEHR